MRFLALSSLQAAVSGVVTASAVVALYFLKHRRQRIMISSIVLWHNLLARRLDNSIFEKLRRITSVALALVTALLVVLAIARPEIDALTGKPRRVMIVIDSSPTMGARSAGGRTRFEHAAERARALVDEGAASTRFRIADTAGEFDSAFTADRDELRQFIGQMHPVMASASFPEVDKDTSEVDVITDGVTRLAAPSDANFLSVFEAALNVGITAFEIRSMPASSLGYNAYLEAVNFGKEPRDIEITVSGTGQQRITRQVRLQSGQSFKEALDLSQFEGGGVRAAVQSSGDALAADDVAYAYLPVKRRTKTLLVTRGNKLLQTALELDRLIELSVTNPAGYAPSNDYDAFVFDGYAPVDAPPKPALVFGPHSAPWLRHVNGTVVRPAFESSMQDHPVMRQISLHDVAVESAARIDASNITVLAASGSTPLIVSSESPRWVMLTFELQASDFPYHAAFPLFIDNVFSWFDHERLALRRTPGVVEVPIEAAQIRTVDGRNIPSQTHLNETAFEAQDPGLYVASRGNSRQYIAVNFANRQYSDINNSHVRESNRKSAAKPLIRRELWLYMLAGALLLLAAEWFMYNRRITV